LAVVAAVGVVTVVVDVEIVVVVTSVVVGAVVSPELAAGARVVAAANPQAEIAAARKE
jgi:hypothetical protein